MKHNIHGSPGFVTPVLNSTQRNVYYSSPLRHGHDHSILSMASAWKCIFKFFKTSPAPKNIKKVATDVLTLIYENNEIEQEIETRGINLLELKKEPQAFLLELFGLLKDQGISLNIAKLQSIKNLVCDRLNVEKQTIALSINYLLSKVRSRSQADVLLLLNDVLVNKGSGTEIPMISSMENMYKQEKTTPTEVLSLLKRELYRVEVDIHLNRKLVKYAREQPPAPPPIFGSKEAVAERKEELKESWGDENTHILKLSEAQLEEAAKSALKCTWSLNFYNAERMICDYPTSGTELLGLDEQTCVEIYGKIVDERINQVKEKILHPAREPGQPFDKVPLVSTYALLPKCRFDQLLSFCRDIKNWERTELDRITRLKDKVNLANDVSFHLPKSIPLIGGGKPMPQQYYVNPEDDPNYFPPGASETLKMMIKIERGDEDQFAPTDPAIIKQELARISKDLELYEDWSAEDMSKLFLKNIKQEFEFGKLVHQRKLRKKALEEENQVVQDPAESGQAEHFSDTQGGKMTKHFIDKHKLVTDVVYFLSHYEHLIWQFEVCMDDPITAISSILRAEDSVTNPKPPKLVFTGPNYQHSFEMLSEYLSNDKSKAHVFRMALNESLRDLDVEDKHKKEVDELPLFDEDALFKNKDQRLVEELSKRGATLTIYSKVPGYDANAPPTESQKQTIFYRMYSSQPSVQLVCSQCGYTIFTHTITAFDGKILHNQEHDAFKENESFTCPICKSGKDKFKEMWTTGQRGYTPEPYPILIDDEESDG